MKKSNKHLYILLYYNEDNGLKYVIIDCDAYYFNPNSNSYLFFIEQENGSVDGKYEIVYESMRESGITEILDAEKIHSGIYGYDIDLNEIEQKLQDLLNKKEGLFNIANGDEEDEENNREYN